MMFLTGSAAAQGLSALTGLLLARWLTISDYALYTIMITLIGAMNVLTKGGAHYGYSTILGRVWPDKARAAQTVSAVLTVRKKVSFYTLPPVILITAWLLHKNGASWEQNIVLCLILLVIWWADMQTRLVDQILFYAHRTTPVQLVDTLLAAGRLLAITALIFTYTVSVIFAVTLSALAAILRMFPILKWVNALVPINKAQPIESDIVEIQSSVRRQLPVEVYMVLQTQIVLVFLSVSASGTDVASFGALGRIGQLLVPVTMFTTAFSVPIFTRARNNIGKTLSGLVVLSLLPGLLVLIIAIYQPQILLWLIGPQYQDLHAEVIWAVGVAMGYVSAKTFRNLVAHRGKMKFNRLQIPLGLFWIVCAPFILDISTLKGAFQLQLGFIFALVFCGLLDFWFDTGTSNTKSEKSD